MFLQHVSKELSAYCNGELSVEDSRRVAEHLIGCSQCRSELEEIKLGIKIAESLPIVAAPHSLWDKLENESGNLARPTISQKRSYHWWPRLVVVAASVLVVVGLLGLWIFQRESRPFWEVVRLDGNPRIGKSAIKGKGQLAVGEWLETDGSSRAQIDVGTIGQVEIDPNTRVRLLETKPTEHRLELARGRMSARIWAPPRLFFVDTPSAVAADMGCAYTLEVDDHGGGILHVTSGWVALQLKDRESMVPAGAACATRPGIGPGTPYFEDASRTFRTALWKFDFEPNDTNWSTIPALDLVLTEARPRDTLTLWHLLSRVNEADRPRVYDRLATLAPPPEGVTRDGVLQLNGDMIGLWKNTLEQTWTNDSFLKKKWVDIWTREKGKGQEGKK